MKGLLIKVLMLCMMFQTSAVLAGESTATINYTGQQFEEVELEQALTETRYRDEEYEDTCYRDEPYTDNVCEQVVVGSDRQCRTIPGYDNCYNVPDRQCRTVTRTRRQCTRGPSREVCERGPSRQDCTRGPSRQQCTRGQGRRVCENVTRERCRQVNGRRVCKPVRTQQCRTVPGERTCRTIPGERTCRTVPGRRVCRTVPGRETCRDVPYTDQDCRTVNRRVCDWVPARQACEDIPIYDTVCRDVTRYRQVPYACTRTRQVPYEFKLKDIKANLKLHFDDAEHKANAEFKLQLKRDGSLEIAAKDKSQAPALIIARRNLNSQDSDELLQIEGDYFVTFRSRTVLNPVTADPKKLKLRKKKISFKLPAVELAQDLAIKATIKSKKGELVFSKIFEAGEGLELERDGDETKVTVNLEEAKLKWLRRYKIELDVRIILPGKVLNKPAPQTKRKIDLSKIRWI